MTPSLFRLPFIFLLLSLLSLLAAAGHAGSPRLMLATLWDYNADPAGWWMSEKYDGVRGYWDGKRMLSRGGEAIALPERLRRALPPFPLDGELWAGHGRFALTLSIVRDRQPGPGWADINYLVFDAPAAAGPFETRMVIVEKWLDDNPAERIRAVKQVRCSDGEHLQRFLDQVEGQGGEGVMLRAAASPYQSGRSAHLRKAKRFDDGEGQVIGYNPGKGKYHGMVGSLQLALPDDSRFAVGSGLSDAERRDPPPIGATVTFKHHGWTVNGKPRFPVFWRVREP